MADDCKDLAKLARRIGFSKKAIDLGGRRLDENGKNCIPWCNWEFNGISNAQSEAGLGCPSHVNTGSTLSSQIGKWATSKGSRQLDRLLDQHVTFREKLEWLEEAETLSLRLRKSLEARSQQNTPETL